MDLRERPPTLARRHPWEVARQRFFERVLSRSGALAAPARFFDVGAGDAFFAGALVAALPAGARVTCWDVGYTPEVVAELRKGAPPALDFAAERPREVFDVLTLLDVLEHVEDDHAFLASLVRENVRAGGVVLVSVPAYPALYTSHDARLLHFRRYAPTRALALLEGAGLRVEARGGLFHSLLPVRALGKAKEALFGPSDAPPSLEWSHGPALTRAVDAFLGLDNALSAALGRARVVLPGLSFWALCRKP